MSSMDLFIRKGPFSPKSLGQWVVILLFKKALIEFIGVTLVNKITYLSSVQFCNTSCVCCTVYSSSQVKSPGENFKDFIGFISDCELLMAWVAWPDSFPVLT